MIQGRVIRILDNTMIVLNVGAKHGVDAGTRFVIINPPEPIFDPATNERLGEYRHRKAVVEARSVYPDFTMAVAPTQVRRIDPLATMSPRTERIQEPLPVDRTHIQPLEGGSEIRIGDLAEELETSQPVQPPSRAEQRARASRGRAAGSEPKE